MFCGILLNFVFVDFVLRSFRFNLGVQGYLEMQRVFSISEYEDTDEQLQSVYCTIRKMPKANHDLLERLFFHLARYYFSFIFSDIALTCIYFAELPKSVV